jgi:hypothetical protein
MNSTCPRCNAAIDPNSRFCTNCGAVLAPQEPYGQSAQPNQAAQVPSWASTNPGAPPYQQQGAPYQQQQWAGQQANPALGGSLGFGGSNDALAKKVITWIVAGLAITIGLLVLFGLLAAFVPFLRGLFCLLLFVAIIVPFIIYSMIRSYVRRTVGRLWWFL